MTVQRSVLIRSSVYIALAIAAVFSFRFDATVRELAQYDLGLWERALKLVSEYGDWPYLMGFAAILLLLGWQLGVGWRRTVVAMIVASTLAGAAVNSLRLTTGRTRPSVAAEQQGWYGPTKFGSYKFNSFPSGHTATAVGFAVPLIFTKASGAIVGVSFIVLMVAARIVVGAHHFSDTICSLLVSVGVVELVRSHVLPRIYSRVSWLKRTDPHDMRLS